jgi:hypothetical protein
MKSLRFFSEIHVESQCLMVMRMKKKQLFDSLLIFCEGVHVYTKRIREQTGKKK